VKEIAMVTASSTAIATLVGYASALPTPFAGDGLDEAAFVALCHWQIEEGISALVVNGTTGEAPTLSEMEQTRLLRLAVAAADRRVPVIAGAGSSATVHAVAHARSAERAGADAILAVTPYYNRPSQEGLFWHFQALHEAVALPILLYDVPSRTGCALAIETICRLAALPRIVGLKDATGDLTRPGVLRRLLGNRFRLLSGDDATALDFMALGGDGCISVLSNVVPKLCNRLHLACACGEAGEARAIERTLMPLTRALFAESNPVPLKWALSLMARMGPTVRLPLCEPAATTRAAIAQALETLHLLAPPSRLRSIGRAVSLCH
jgi:4-hydroxy-tetrahydrodipicolinate synthase